MVSIPVPTKLMSIIRQKYLHEAGPFRGVVRSRTARVALAHTRDARVGARLEFCCRFRSTLVEEEVDMLRRLEGIGNNELEQCNMALAIDSLIGRDRPLTNPDHSDKLDPDPMLIRMIISCSFFPDYADQYLILE